MERIYDKKKIAACVGNGKYHEVLGSLDVDFCLMQYEKGELVSSPFQNENLFQIVEEESINICFIRDDGTRYPLSSGTVDYFLGDMDIFYPKNNNIYAEAAESLACLSFSIERHREKLLSNNKFLELICNSLSTKIGVMTTIEAAGLVKKLGKGTYGLRGEI